MPNEFAQMFSLTQQAQANQMNQLIGLQNLSLRREGMDLQRQNLAVAQQRNAIDAAQLSMERGKALVSTYATLAPGMSVEQKKQYQPLIMDVLSNYGLVPEGQVLKFDDLEDAIHDIQVEMVRGNTEGAQARYTKWFQNSFPEEREHGSAVLRSTILKKNLEAQPVEGFTDGMSNLLQLEREGRLLPQSEAERRTDEGVGKSIDARAFQEQLDKGEFIVIPDDAYQSVRARKLELSGLDPLPAERRAEVMEVDLLAALGGQVSDEKLQRAINTKRYMTINSFIARAEAAGKPVTDETYRMRDDAAIDAGLMEKRKAPLNEVDQEKLKASQQKRMIGQTQIAMNAQKINMMTKQMAHLDLDNLRLEKSMPLIDAGLELLNNKNLALEEQIALTKENRQRLRQQYEGMGQLLRTSREKVTGEIQEIEQRLEAELDNPNGPPQNIELLQDALHMNNDRLKDLDAEIAFAESVGTENFMEYQNLLSNIEFRKKKAESLSNGLDSLKIATAKLRGAQLVGEEFDNLKKQEEFRDKNAAGLVAAQAARENISGDQNIIKLVDRMKASGEIDKNAIVPPKAVTDNLTEADGGSNDPFAVTRAVKTASDIAARHSLRTVVNPITGQIDPLSMLEQNPKNIEEYYKILQVQADSNPSLKPGLQPIIDEGKATYQRVQAHRKQFLGIEKKLPHNLSEVIHPELGSMSDIAEKIEDGKLTDVTLESEGTLFHVERGASGKVEISAEINGRQLTFALEGSGRKRRWIFLDEK